MPGRVDTRPAALVTGASSGIGLALARRLATQYRVIATGRRPEGAIGGGLPDGATYVEADMRRPDEAAGTIDAALAGHGVDGLALAILCAGAGFYRAPEDETAEEVRQTLDVNLAAPIVLSHRLAPRLKAVRGRLVLVGSVARRGSPRMAAYAASKAGIDGFARSLRQEWRGAVVVQAIHPGATATGMHERAGFHPGELRRIFFTPDAMAAAILAAMKTARSPVTISWRQRLTGALRREVAR